MALRAGFNSIRRRLVQKNTSPSTPIKRTGLFGIDQLQKPEGFHSFRDEALKKANILVNEILSRKPNTTGNIVGLFDELSNCLCRVADLAEFVRVSHPNTKFRAAAEQASVAISNLVEELNTNTSLYNALKREKFDNELDDHVAKLFIFDFEQSGIHLDDEKRRQVIHLNENILKLGSIFSSNANQPRLVEASDIPQSIRHFFNSDSTGKIQVSGLHADVDNELVRETAYHIYAQHDEIQDQIFTDLLLSRLRLAQLCGFESYAHRAVKGSIAGSPEVVNDFLSNLRDRLKDLAASNYEQMLILKASDTSRKDEKSILNAWDVPYYSASHKRSLYNESVQQCLPYFSIGACMDGLNMIFNELYGVQMQVVDTNNYNGELWHNDVIKLSIIDQETNTLLGYIYCDLFERPLKYHQDCHHTIQGGCYLRDGSYQTPIVVLVLSLPSNTNDNRPSLLAPSMVDNLFHEMGHAMHSMMARTKYQHITGTRCSTDLAEVPSILMEFFASDPRVVSKFARHYSSGEQIPSELLRNWLKSKRVFSASETQLQVFYAALDQAYHNSSVSGLGRSITTTDILARTQSEFYPIPYVDGTAWQLRFSHLISYGAKYYSYLVSRAIATAIWTKLFVSNPLSSSAGRCFKNEVLAHGGGKPAHKIAEDILSSRVDAEFMARNVIASFEEPKI